MRNACLAIWQSRSRGEPFFRNLGPGASLSRHSSAPALAKFILSLPRRFAATVWIVERLFDVETPADVIVNSVARHSNFLAAKKAGVYRGRKHLLSNERAAELRSRLVTGEQIVSRLRVRSGSHHGLSVSKASEWTAGMNLLDLAALGQEEYADGHRVRFSDVPDLDGESLLAFLMGRHIDSEVL